MAQDNSNISHGWRDFFIGIAIMLVVVLIAFALAGNEPKTVYPGGTPNTCDMPGC